MNHEQKMQKAWSMINELGITEDQEEYYNNPEMYLVDDIHQVRDAFYSDIENEVEIEDEDLPGFFARHGIEYQ